MCCHKQLIFVSCLSVFVRSGTASNSHRTYAGQTRMVRKMIRSVSLGVDAPSTLSGLETVALQPNGVAAAAMPAQAAVAPNAVASTILGVGTAVPVAALPPPTLPVAASFADSGFPAPPTIAGLPRASPVAAGSVVSETAVVTNTVAPASAVRGSAATAAAPFPAVQGTKDSQLASTNPSGPAGAQVLSVIASPANGGVAVNPKAAALPVAQFQNVPGNAANTVVLYAASPPMVQPVAGPSPMLPTHILAVPAAPNATPSVVAAPAVATTVLPVTAPAGTAPAAGNATPAAVATSSVGATLPPAFQTNIVTPFAANVTFAPKVIPVTVPEQPPATPGSHPEGALLPLVSAPLPPATASSSPAQVWTPNSAGPRAPSGTPRTSAPQIWQAASTVAPPDKASATPAFAPAAPSVAMRTGMPLPMPLPTGVEVSVPLMPIGAASADASPAGPVHPHDAVLTSPTQISILPSAPLDRPANDTGAAKSTIVSRSQAPALLTAATGAAPSIATANVTAGSSHPSNHFSIESPSSIPAASSVLDPAKAVADRSTALVSASSASPTNTSAEQPKTKTEGHVPLMPVLPTTFVGGNTSTDHTKLSGAPDLDGLHTAVPQTPALQESPIVPLAAETPQSSYSASQVANDATTSEDAEQRRVDEAASHRGFCMLVGMVSFVIMFVMWSHRGNGLFEHAAVRFPHLLGDALSNRNKEYGEAAGGPYDPSALRSKCSRFAPQGSAATSAAHSRWTRNTDLNNFKASSGTSSPFLAAPR